MQKKKEHDLQRLESRKSGAGKAPASKRLNHELA